MCDQVRAGSLWQRDCGGQEPDAGGGGAGEGDVDAEERPPLSPADQRAPQGTGEGGSEGVKLLYRDDLKGGPHVA